MGSPVRPRLASATVLFLSVLAAATDKSVARDLTFEDRVKAQEAIERVYYSHQIGATEPFAAAVPRARLELKVRTYLKQTQALERFWRTAVTAEMLGQELQRMTSGSRMPDRFRELEAALGDDPFLIQETLARPVLVDRLTRNFFASDAIIHGKERRESEALREDLARGRLDPRFEHPRRTVVEVARTDDVAGADGDESGWYRTLIPSGNGGIGQVQEEREAFVIRVPLTLAEDMLRVATFVVRKQPWEEWWALVEGDLQESSIEAVARPDNSLPIAQTDRSGVFADSTCPGDDTWDIRTLDGLPSPRRFHTAVWTGSVMVVWGGVGVDGIALNTGGRYDPATDTWAATSTINAPQGRFHHTALWTGTLMVVWGGHSGINIHENLGSGARYDPVTDTWAPVSATNAPVARIEHSAVWTGSRMIVWGGYRLRHVDPEFEIHIVYSYLNDGGQYDPATDTWTSISTTNAPSARARHAAVWTGGLMVVWGGGTIHGLGNTGGRYDPVADTWTATSTTNAPSARYGRGSVWTGKDLIVWGGASDTTVSRYDPATDTWSSTSTTNAPSARYGHTAVWTGSQVIVWGGTNDTTGSRYDPATDTWASTSTTNAPSARYGHTIVWTGSQVIVWGGYGINANFSTGGRYDPSADTWTATYTTLAPWGNLGYTAVWTGNVLLVWGGGRADDTTGRYDSPTGVRYDPATDTWTATSTTNAPSPRLGHTAIWTGSRMVVWGGRRIDSASAEFTATGGRYDPASDIWTPTSTANSPAARYGHTSMWTGDMMLVWGGFDSSGALLDTGGRYNPATDTWTSTSILNTPSARRGYSAIWAGSRMVVWGGYGIYGDNDTFFNTGGRYDPVADVWSPISTTNAPSGRFGHSVVWTGSQMIVWGGRGQFYLWFDKSGGRYDPVTDIWAPTDTTNAPNARGGHAAVWTGRLMLIWGGSPHQALSPSARYIPLSPHGSRYDPFADSWSPMSTLNEPSFHGIGVWTGRELILLSPRGGRYTPSASAPFYRDLDGDGHGDPGDSVMACAPPAGYATNSDDCDDGDPSTHPGAAEVCNGRDDDCTGGVDDGPGASASCDDGDDCTLDACQAGTCLRTEAIVPQAVCTAEPATLNLDSKGREFGVTVSLANRCPGQRLDPAMLTPIYLAGLASPSLGTVTLPVPDSRTECTQDGIWETVFMRGRLAPGSMRVAFFDRSDGLCATLDGNRQDIIALLRAVSDREPVQVFFKSSYPGAATPVSCGATVTVLNHP